MKIEKVFNSFDVMCWALGRVVVYWILALIYAFVMCLAFGI